MGKALDECFSEMALGFGYLLLDAVCIQSHVMFSAPQMDSYSVMKITQCHIPRVSCWWVICTKMCLNFRCTIHPNPENWLKINENWVLMILESKKVQFLNKWVNNFVFRKSIQNLKSRICHFPGLWLMSALTLHFLPI